MPRRKLNRFKVEAPSDQVLEKYLTRVSMGELYKRPNKVTEVSSEAYFGNGNALVLDLGCGRGEYTVSTARENPDRNVIGVDFHLKSLLDAVSRAASQKLENVRFIRADLRWFMRIVPDASVVRILLLFPPPILERKYASKEYFSEEFCEELSRALEVNGVLEFATDVSSYFHEKVALLDRVTTLERVRIQEAFEGGLTWYQSVWESHALPTLRAEYVRQHD